MAEGNHGAMPDLSDLPDADTPIPPIDNIHAPKTEPDFLSASAHEQHPIYTGGQVDTEMPEAAVRYPKSPCHWPKANR